MSLFQRHKNSLLFESQLSQGDEKIPPIHFQNSCWIWSDRIVFIKNQNDEKDEEFWNFIALDLLMNESRPIRFPKINKFRNQIHIDIIPLSTEFGIILEKFNRISCFNFVRIDWDANEFQLIENIEKERCWCFNVIVDKMNPTKFILEWTNFNSHTSNYQACKLLNGKIELGEIFQHETSFDLYSKDKVFWISRTEIEVYDLMKNKEEIFEIDASKLSENVCMTYYYKEWVNDRLYAKILFNNRKKCGLVWVDLAEKCWEIMDFEIKLEIEGLKFVDGNLIMRGNRKSDDLQYLDEIEYHTIPMRRPNHLRYSAWFLVVKIMKNNGEKDPYKEAKEFLPLNSDLREMWFKDEEK